MSRMVLASRQELQRTLQRIDGRGYKAYQDIRGGYDFGDFHLFVDHVQGDPFAAPSKIRVRVPQANARLAADLFSNRIRRVAFEDFLTRATAAVIRRVVKGDRGIGGSGRISIDSGRQEILERSAMKVTPEFVEARLSVGLPAAGRTVLGRQAEEMFFQEIPAIVSGALVARTMNLSAARQHVDSCEDQETIRRLLPEKGLIAFIGDGSILPRLSGVSDAPMPKEQAVAFFSPPSLKVTLQAPNAGEMTGMGIPQGVTLIVGGGYHGKSTLLRALEKGVYNHIPGDGRDRVATVPDGVKIRAENGRRVEKVDISPFINDLPYGRRTDAFCSDEASGSTSQAANIVEALEVGARLLLIDEDTSATNFMIRDARMQRLVSKDKEPITPFIDRVRLLYRDLGVSTVLVMGGSGDYFDVADRVIMMESYRPYEVTGQARAIAEEMKTWRVSEGEQTFQAPRRRVPIPSSLDPSKGKRDAKVGARGLDEIMFGRHPIDLSFVEQVVDPSQTRAIGAAILYALDNLMDGRRSLAEIVHALDRLFDEKGLDVLSPFRDQHPGELARPRPFEIAAAINRLRTLSVRQV